MVTKQCFIWVYQYDFSFIVRGGMLLLLYPLLFLSSSNKKSLGMAFVFMLYTLMLLYFIISPSVYHKIQFYLC